MTNPGIPDSCQECGRDIHSYRSRRKGICAVCEKELRPQVGVVRLVCSRCGRPAVLVDGREVCFECGGYVERAAGERGCRCTGPVRLERFTEVIA